MEILKTEVKEATRKKFSGEMSGRVKLLFFTQEPSRLVVPDYLKGQECLFCQETRRLLEEVAGLSEKIELVVYDFVADQEKAAEHAVNKIPAIVVRGETDSRIRFFGIPSGYEYMSLIEAIVDVSRGSTGLSAKTKESLRALENDVHIQVFVTPTCPYCTVAVRLAHQCALESPRIRGEMIEATEFPHLAQKYHVFGVPRTVMNESVMIDGAISEQIFLEHILKAAGLERK
jgi:glutaredoxin-like protein